MQPRTLARRFTLAVLLALELSPAAFAKSSSSSYTLTVAGPADSAAAGVNASGQLIGTVGNDSFVWTPTTNSRVDLDFGSWTTAYGINDAGQVVGLYQPDSSDAYSAFVWTNELFQTPSPLAGHTNSSAFAINNSGVVVGSSDGGGELLPVRWMTGSATAEVLSTETGLMHPVEARGINASGQVIGHDGQGSAYFWSSPTDYSILKPLAGLTGSTANAINASGQIVGYSAGSSSGSAVRWDNASIAPIDLCTISTANSSAASAINASGQVVGYVTLESLDTHGFVYSDGAMTDLNTLLTGAEGWTITSAVGINDLGWIAANAWDGTNSYAVLLTPEGSAIPEPSTYAALLGVGVLGWAAWKRRRHAA